MAKSAKSEGQKSLTLTTTRLGDRATYVNTTMAQIMRPTIILCNLNFCVKYLAAFLKLFGIASPRSAGILKESCAHGPQTPQDYPIAPSGSSTAIAHRTGRAFRKGLT